MAPGQKITFNSLFPRIKPYLTTDGTRKEQETEVERGGVADMHRTQKCHSVLTKLNGLKTKSFSCPFRKLTSQSKTSTPNLEGSGRIRELRPRSAFLDQNPLEAETGTLQGSWEKWVEAVYGLCAGEKLVGTRLQLEVGVTVG